ncbi:MAG: FG-GAP repeat domain-containing protein, partial [Halobacteriaceae archaeon]
MRGTAAGLAVAALVVLAGCSGIVGTQGPAVDATATAPAGGEPDAEPALAFREASAEHGFTYFTTRTPRESLVANEGVYVTDYNGDGWPDILAVGGGPRLYENTGGAFEAADALPEVEGYVKVAHFLDYDADGDDDLLLFRKRAAPVALRNTGGGFERAEVGLAGAGFVVPNAVTSADYDGDGCLDLFVGQNGDWGTGAPGTDATARAVYNGTERPVITDGHQNLLFDGDCGSFSNVTREAGIATGVWGSQWTLTASFVDLTGDGHPDIHVGNDFGRDLLYVNEGDGTFRVVDAGPATDRNAMASEVADVNGDGRLDVYVTNIHITPNMTVPEDAPISKVDIAWNPNGNNLLLNRGNGSFVDRAAEYGVRAAGFGWSAALADLDNDGHRDLLHATSTDVPITGYEERGYLQPQLWAGTPEGFDRRDATAVGFNRTNGRGLAT